MRALRIATIVGARPQFIKAAAVRRAVAAHNAASPAHAVQDIFIHTGQHYDANMSDVFFKELDLPEPDYHLGVADLSHGAMTGRMLEQIEAILVKEKPDWVLIYGDTNSTLAGALAAAKLCIPLAHVEAGLRSFNRQMPEEINRIVADHCSDLLLTTSTSSSTQLRREGIPDAKIREVGDVMCDVARHYGTRNGESVLAQFGLQRSQYVLATIHRPATTDSPDRLKEVMMGLSAIAAEVPVILPAHPRTRQALNRLGNLSLHPGLHIVDPIGYVEMLALEGSAKLIITDSGGVQREAYFCHVPCLIVRDETEWTELIERGFSRLVPGQSSAIHQAYREMLSQTFNWNIALYGQGDASQKILQALF